ncbi:unnamed protein product [Adineta ricciae]|uniref:Wax synthase domain-containing protein n=1 Tax=Adineta ricciae TaxID=249248 RepID=A0A813NCG2_ADIRI|nr:unnamed protein product [Adineta ricciae]CAF1471573.1 unnamed protein product [Adineta ricciae]
MDPMLIRFGWAVHLILCYYVIRPLRYGSHRALFTMIPCSILLFAGCQNLPHVQMSSVMTVSLYWMISIRLFHLIVLSPNESCSFPAYICKFLWFLLPVTRCQSKTPLSFYLASASIKLLINQWIFQWLRVCPPNDSYGRLAMFYISICSGTFFYDLQAVVVRLVTRHQYTVLDFNDYPFLSKSLREFWGRRYNRLVGTLLKESLFDPIRRLFKSSAMFAALACFVVSGFLHAHVATAAFGASSPLPAFTFFVLQGIACCIVAQCPFTVPKIFGIALTHTFLLLTAPLYIGLFTRADPLFYKANKPPLLDATWLPKLPVPNVCPQ